ncbi:MAG: Ferrochelatase [Alphaproteobacteria bacterium MarineAlpha5_Bin5]|nr:MAG: Ferrochelatase [Alphaproteobacteria bacterium MarineAlpha5_Bin4]PPR51084.1 MAG: Ferrochelatase [Alphaproteobacteria bacterium MarineAlpha5_Bin5]|tara:strand:+ start:1126 stop:2088 length:963 start_codon:yes stop_codon:yes gene_type:complete
MKKNNIKGILIVNTGSPSSLDSQSIRLYLKEFLSDKRVIHLPRLFWLPILYLFILPFRPQKKIKDYRKIWMKDGSPLLVLSKKLIKKLNKGIGDKGIYYRLAMRYGEPNIKDQLICFREQKISKLIILPLFPQFSYSTTESVIDKVQLSLKELNWELDYEIIKEYYNEHLFVSSIGNKIKNEWKENGKKDLLVFSYHGLPKKYVDKGDTYYQACCNTSELIAKNLSLDHKDYITSFHSKFGFGEWTKPYTENLLTDLPKKGIKSINIISPTFSIDCLETLEEIAIQFENDFIESGGNYFKYIPCLNDSDEHVKLIERLVN